MATDADEIVRRSVQCSDRKIIIHREMSLARSTAVTNKQRTQETFAT